MQPIQTRFQDVREGNLALERDPTGKSAAEKFLNTI
jgi:hypothetical protein